METNITIWENSKVPENYNSTEPIELSKGVYHLGVQDKPNSFSNIPYLIVDGDEAVVIDPGSAIPEFYEVVIKKLRSVIDLKQIKHIIVQHQDADLCAAMPLLEKEAADDVQLMAPLEAKVLVQHYGMQRELIPVDDGDTLTFGNGRKLEFIATPYCHFVGAMVTYDEQTKTLFSSDIFGGFTGLNKLYAGEDYPVQLSAFLGQYLSSKRALEYALKRIEMLMDNKGVDMICPQHGCVIPKDQIAKYMTEAHNLEVGGEVDSLAIKHGIELD